MQEQTGAMAQFENDLDALDAGYTPLRELINVTKEFGKTKVSAEQMQRYWADKTNELYGMNRHDRRAWASQQRKTK